MWDFSSRAAIVLGCANRAAALKAEFGSELPGGLLNLDSWGPHTRVSGLGGLRTDLCISKTLTGDAAAAAAGQGLFFEPLY